MRSIVFKATIAPLFEYYASILIGLSDANLQYLQKLQNRGMRIILRCNLRTKIKDMLEALQFMSIRERIEYNVYILIHKMINGRCPSYLNNKIELVQSRGSIVRTRQEGNIYIVKSKTTEGQKMLLHDGFVIFNSLPNEVKSEHELQSFKKALVPYIKSRKLG